MFSYLWLRGRCRHCGAHFSVRYALVEAACGAVAVLSGLTFGLSLYALAIFIVCLCLIAVFYIDLDHMIIPDEFVAIIAVLGLVNDGWTLIVRRGATAIRFGEQIGGSGYIVYLPRSVAGLLVGAGLLLFVGWVFEKLMGKPSMGGGDVKLAGAMGTWLGPGYLFLSYFLIAVVAGAIVGLAAMALKLRGRRDYIPFGPMLAGAGIVMLLWGDVVGPWVLGRFAA